MSHHTHSPQEIAEAERAHALRLLANRRRLTDHLATARKAMVGARACVVTADDLYDTELVETEDAVALRRALGDISFLLTTAAALAPRGNA